MRAPPPGSPAIIPDYCRPLPTIIRQERTRRRTWPALTRTRLLRPGHRRLKSRLVQLLRSAASGPPAGVGWQQPEADFLKCKSGPKWQRRAAAGYGHAREQHWHAIWRLRSGAHVTLAPHRIRHPETDKHRREQSPGGGDTTTAQPAVTSLLTRWPCRAHYKAAAPATGRAQAGRFRSRRGVRGRRSDV
jgi:hypothetical protein